MILTEIIEKRQEEYTARNTEEVDKMTKKLRFLKKQHKEQRKLNQLDQETWDSIKATKKPFIPRLNFRKILND